MQHNVKNDCDIEDLIELMYKISDALDVCETDSVEGFVSIQNMREILSDAQSRTAILLGRFSERHHKLCKDETVNSQSINISLVPNYN